MREMKDINSSRVIVDSWSWFPRIAAHGIWYSITGPKTLNKDSAASEVLGPNMLSPDQETKFRLVSHNSNTNSKVLYNYNRKE